MKVASRMAMKKAHRAKRHLSSRRPLNSRPLRLNVRAITPAGDSRSGAVLVVVLALLGLLMLVGFTFYTFSNQEASNAEYYANAAKELTDPGLDPDTLFDWGLKQVIMGAPNDLRNSALWGGRHSMLANMFGHDIHPFNGRGVNVALNGALVPYVDQNFDEAGDPGGNALLELNDSPVARNGGTPALSTNYPMPDVDYTAPDLNTLFLGYRGYALDELGRPVFVVIPSFHRPQLLRTTNATPMTNPFRNSNTPTKVLRPHLEHAQTAGHNRYVEDTAAVSTLGLSGPFPFDVEDQGVWNMDYWKPSKAYEVGDWIYPSDGSGNGQHTGVYFRCNLAGTSGSGPINWATYTPGMTFNDGTVEWECFAQPKYRFDADADGDGIYEAIYLDLDFPVQRLGDGRQFVPMFAFSIYDADGLLNLLAHGNINGFNNIGNTSEPFGGTSGPNVMGLSWSNMGLFPTEVNPQYALNARPRELNNGGDRPNGQDFNVVFKQHQLFYQRTLNENMSWQELANMEWFWANVGRFQFTAPGVYEDAYPGRYGELNRLQLGWSSSQPTAFPFAGVSQVDDNSNLNLGEAINGQRPWVFPLDFRGTGQGLNGRQTMVASLGMNRWPMFQGYSSRDTIGFAFGIDGRPGRAGVDDNSNGSVDFLNNGLPDMGELGASGSDDNPIIQNLLLTSPHNSALMDEAIELSADPRVPVNGDEIFGPQENAFLAASDGDIISAGIHTRLSKLLEWNLKNNVRAQQIRERFTTTSFDIKNFGLPWYQTFGPRTWEWENINGTQYRFPPQFSGNDPFRAPLRRLLQVIANDLSQNPPTNQQRKFSLNHFLTFDNAGNLQNRDLAEHPVSLGREAVVNPNLGASPSQAHVQEWNARLERQQMARDIYVLLYFFCGGQDNVNPFLVPNTGVNGNRTVYNDDQLEEMAQFAINLVNAIDKDHVIDAFEYDKNLQDGWDLDDDPYSTTDNMHPDRGLVYGVESQLLTMSEVQAIYAKEVDGGTVNHAATEYDDMDDRYFTYIELRNAGQFKTSLANGSWRIIMRPLDNPDPTRERYLTPRFGSVDPGQLFTIGTAGDALNTDPMTGQPRPSYFRVDPYYQTMMSSMQTIAPKTPPAGNAWMDLITDDLSHFQVKDGANTDLTGTRGAFLNSQNFSSTAIGERIEFVLQRRMDLTRQAPTASNAQEESDNPWIEVDRMTLENGLSQFTLAQADDSTAIQTKLAALKSRFRTQPLNRNAEGFTTPQSFFGNTLGEDNNTTAFDRWQYVFNRPLASEVELFSIPLFSPKEVTRDTSWEGSETAGVKKFLSPEFITNQGKADLSKIPKLDNRWYRLLGFAEVPSRSTTLGNFRVAGKLNWNTIRHPEVWAGLLDSTAAFNNMQPLIPKDKQVNYLPDAASENGRDWWKEFIKSRDGLYLGGPNDLTPQSDPRTQLFLPGMPGGRPFRDLTFIGEGYSSLEHTFLRHLPVDTTDPFADPDHDPVRRRLLELRSQVDVNGNTKIDHYARHQLLSKVLGNSTTRSNVFFVFVQVDFFEAVTDGSGEVRIGKKLDDSPSHRGFFVVDRSLAVPNLKPNDFKAASDPDYFTFKDTFNFHSLIIHRQRLE